MTTDDQELYFDFATEAYPADQWGVARFHGREAISDLYVYEIDLVSSDETIDPAKIINKPGTIILDRNDDRSFISGIVISFEQGDRGPSSVSYHAVLAPPLYRLGLTRRSQVFLEKNVETIIDEVLKENGLQKGKDYSFHLTGTHPDHEYVVQYEESDLNFIRRWMEHEGIFFYFVHAEEGVEMVIADHKGIHKPITGDPEVKFRDARSTNPGGEAIGRFRYTRQILPGEVLLKDYNYRKPSLEIKGTAPAIPQGVGLMIEYGNHFKDPGFGSKLAEIRAQEITCRENIGNGESAVHHLRSGFKFTMVDHFLADLNQEYLLVEVEHQAEQPGVLGLSSESTTGRGSYINFLKVIPAAQTFRAARVTPKPRIYGIMHATVDGGTSGQYAEIDEMGRYKVKLPWDLSGRGDGKASRFIRMAQPYSGPEYGMHFPLHKDTEVMLIHLDGDPDRPIIAGTVPNPNNASPVTGANHTQSRIRTAADNEIVMEDTAGAEYVMIRTPNQDTHISIGADHHSNHAPPGVTVGSQFGVSLNAGKGITITAGSPNHDEGISSQGAMGGKVAAVAGTVAGVTSLVGGLAADAFAAGIAKAAPSLIGDVGGFIAGVSLPGVYVTAPGKAAITAGGEVVIGAIGSCDMIALGPANILSVAGAMVAGLKGATVVSLGKVEIISGLSDVLIEAKKKGNVLVEAKKNVKIEAHKEDIRLETKARNIIIDAEKDLFLTTAKGKAEVLIEKDIAIESVTDKKIVLQAGKSKITMTNDKILIEADQIEIKSNDKDGRINVGKGVIGKSVEIEGKNHVWMFSDKHMTIGAEDKLALGTILGHVVVNGKKWDATAVKKTLHKDHDDNA